MSSDLGEVPDARPAVNNTLVVSVGGDCVQLTIYEFITIKGEIFLDRDTTYKLLGILEAAYRVAW